MQYICTDLEATCWDIKTDPANNALQPQKRRVIEIASIKMNAGFDVIDSFTSFVNPSDTLTDYCKNLTHISQDQVDSAPDWDTVYNSWIDWVSCPSDTTFLSWGDDLSMINYQVQRIGRAPANFKDFIDIGVDFKFWAKCKGGFPSKNQSVSSACLLLGLTLKKPLHVAINDADMANQIFRHIRNPNNISLTSREALGIVIERGSKQPTNRSHIKDNLDLLSKWKRITRELSRVSLVKDIGNGVGLVPTNLALDLFYRGL